MSERKIVDLTLARLQRRHDTAAWEISEALGILREGVATRPRLNSRVTRGHLELSPRKRLLSVGCSYRWMAHVGGMNSTAMSPAAKPVS